MGPGDAGEGIAVVCCNQPNAHETFQLINSSAVTRHYVVLRGARPLCVARVTAYSCATLFGSTSRRSGKVSGKVSGACAMAASQPSTSPPWHPFRSGKRECAYVLACRCGDVVMW